MIESWLSGEGSEWICVPVCWRPFGALLISAELPTPVVDNESCTISPLQPSPLSTVSQYPRHSTTPSAALASSALPRRSHWTVTRVGSSER